MDFDLIIIGAGPGGCAAAERAADLGLKTAVIEKGPLGGTCLNRGCMPTKALLHAAGLYAGFQKANAFGITAEQIFCDFARMQAAKNAAVEQLRSGIAQTFHSRKITHIIGTAQIVSAHEVRVGPALYTAKNLLIAVGAAPVRPPIPGLDLPGVVTSDDLLSPEGRDFGRLAIIGGGVIGVEFATIYGALGRQVTILEAAPRILPSMDKEISQSLTMLLKKRGLSVVPSAKVAEIKAIENHLTITYTDKQGTNRVCEADGVLVAVGRRACLDGLFAEGLAPETEGGALVCDRNETSIKGIFAIGDAVAGNIQLAHAARAQGVAVVHRLSGRVSPIAAAHIPSCVYTDPEIACVGLTEEQAKAAGIPIMVGKAPTAANGKSVIERADRGFIKLLFRAEDEVLIGAQMMCARATDFIAVAALAVTNGLTRAQLLATVLPHPTYSESLTQAAESARKR